MLQLHYQSLRPLTTAHLAQTMSLLSLTAAELRQQIDSELASNPALELVEERRCPVCHRLIPGKGACPVCSHPRQASPEEPVVFISPREIMYGSGDNYGGAVSDGEDLPEDRFSSMGEELPVYVFRQVAPDIAPEDRKLAAHLLTNLNEDGLLEITLLEAARYLHVPLSRLEQVQRIIQHADPLGVGSGSAQEALLVQLEILAETGLVPALAGEMIRKGMGLLSRRQYAELARQLKAPLAKVQEAAHFISENLNPYPARSAWGEARQPAREPSRVYYQPDMIITLSNHRTGEHAVTAGAQASTETEPEPLLMVEIIMPLWGTLRVNPLYRQAVQESGGPQKEALREDLDRASLFVKCLQQRNHTIQRLMQRIVSLQRDFIYKGEKYLHPLTRAQIALELEVHESTISRAVANKAVQMPNGRIIPLSCFFDRSLNVRTVLRELVEGEAVALSDSELAVMLAERGYNVARRTVAKYRSMEGILPANLRHLAAERPQPPSGDKSLFGNASSRGSV